MIEFETTNLYSVKDRFEELSVIANNAIGVSQSDALTQLESYAAKGTNVTLMYQNSTLIGYLLFGEVEKFIDWNKNLPIKLELVRRGITDVYCVSHIHVLKNYWKKGLTAAMAVEYCSRIQEQGGKHLLIWGAATEELAQYALKKVGSYTLEGVKDRRGHSVGYRIIEEFLEQERPQ